ncbi:uncharacterized protein EI90DRAFT_3042612 [Cantharellus anzutake]|uniref:uncharacterized protein n=1 Tax=Cantharellus anzutake TaxID=1750568 RepID=UPI0019052253|nr:uncharacterized protein EI90DRAFT_3042612 [Cantharellus anzutake]KAF8337335.1 hypothetical protein EI90DRAFT_3042612 [Cantharellus anzutake]
MIRPTLPSLQLAATQVVCAQVTMMTCYHDPHNWAPQESSNWTRRLLTPLYHPLPTSLHCRLCFFRKFLQGLLATSCGPTSNGSLPSSHELV